MRRASINLVTVGLAGLALLGWCGLRGVSLAQQPAGETSSGNPPPGRNVDGAGRDAAGRNATGRVAAAPQLPGPAVKPLILADGMIALSSDTADGKQQVVVIDTKNRGMSVYHVDHATGAIALRSARNITADLLMDEFNTNNPLPEEIRSLLKANKDKR